MREFVIPIQSMVLYQNWFSQLMQSYCMKKEGTY